MLASDSSDEGVTTSLLGKRTASPPVAMRSSKSVLSQVRDTLFSFMKRSKLDDAASKDKENQPQKDSSSIVSASEKQRSLEAFTDRIKSFTVQNWMGKPLCLSPPLLAQYGWQCIGVDTLKCCSCRAVLSVRLPWPSEGNYRLQCGKYRQKVLTGHMKICSWPSYACPDSFIAPFLHGVHGIPEVIIEFIERRTNLMQLRNKLPKLDPGFLKEISLERRDVKTLASVNGSVLEPTPQPEAADDYFADFSEIETASLLAMCGWDTEHSSSSRLPAVFCKSSGRVIMLHNFFALNEAVDPTASDSNEDCPTSKLIDCENSDSSNLSSSNHDALGDKNSRSPLKRRKQFFHPLQQHPPWSHWIAALKPISKAEFDDNADSNDAAPSTATDLYQYVINPLIPDTKPGWHLVMNVLLGQRGDGEKLNLPAVTSSTQSEPGQSYDDVGKDGHLQASKSPAKSAVSHARQLLKEWSSPK